jgi:Flp pilus assembly protein TadB
MGFRSAIATSRWARRLAIGIALIGAVLLFLLNLRAGEQAGRTAERLQQMERTSDALRRMLEAGADRPRDRDDLAERLRDGRF